MLSFKSISSDGGIGSYYEEEDDYYTKEEHRGLWEGVGAEALGLSGPVDRAMFKQMLNGVLPGGQEIRRKMTLKQGDGKLSAPRLAIDFTFSAPKSVSIGAMVNNDPEIVRSHNDAVRAAIARLEKSALARKKIRGVSYRQNTNNLVVAAFQHDLSRSQDPQLHTHAVVMNMTQRDDGQWVALTNDDMLKNVKLVGAFYRAELARSLKEKGYALRSTRDGFELAGISDKAIRLFSQRSQKIEGELAKIGLDREHASAKIKQKITMATRPKKKTDADRAKLREEWVDLLAQAGIGIEIQKPPVGTPGTQGCSPGAQPPKPPAPQRPDTDDFFDNPAHVGLMPTGQNVKKPRQGKLNLKPPANNQRGTVPETAQTSGADDPPSVESDIARLAVDFAIEHLAERQGIFTRSELLERAMLCSLGSLDAIEAELKVAAQDGRLAAELPLFQSAKSFSNEQGKNAVFQAEQFKVGADIDINKVTRSSWVALTMAKTGRSQSDAEKLVDDSIRNGRLVATEERYATPAMIAAESAVLRMETSGRGEVAAIKTEAEVTAIFAASALNQGQKEAARLILTTQNRIIGIQGYAGTGKSHMLSEAVDVIKAEAAKAAQEQGYNVIGIAPYASQNKALADLGMQSQTLASFLLRKTDQALLNPKAIVFLDESSVVPAHQMQALMEKVIAAGARLILIGDKKQIQSVESGKPFEQLQEQGMTTAHLTEILRQKTPELRAAVVSVAGGHVDAAVRHLSARTVEIPKEETRHSTIASDYAALSIEERQKTLIVAGTNAARRSINELVREKINLPDNHDIATYDSIDMTRAEKKQVGSYAPGQTIMLEGVAGQGLAPRVYYEIESISNSTNELTVREAGGMPIVVNPGTLRNLSVFEKQTLPLARGDWVRVTRNNTPLGVANGDHFEVGTITQDGIQLSNGAILPRTGRLHLQHGYATTVHSAQGMTTKRVLIDAATKSLTSNRAVFYVAISRPREDLTVYTDSRADLTKAMTREPKKYAALELRGIELEEKVLAAAKHRQVLQQAVGGARTSKQRQQKNTTARQL